MCASDCSQLGGGARGGSKYSDWIMSPSSITRYALVLVLINVAVAILVITRPRVRNFGPDQNALVASGRHVHRHDLLYQWRVLGITVAEWVPERLYVYNRGQFCSVGPTPPERAEYYSLRGASTAQSTIKQYKGLSAPIASPSNHSVAICWGPLIAAFFLINLLGGATCFLVARAWRRRRARRVVDGCCQRCGYDLRASIYFGRCPECGFPIPNQG